LTSPVLHTAALVDANLDPVASLRVRDGGIEFHENSFVGFGALRADRVIGEDSLSRSEVSPCRSEVSGEFDAVAAEDHQACQAIVQGDFVRRGYRATGAMTATRQSNACSRANGSAQIFLPRLLPERLENLYGQAIRLSIG
jgi:hypothetical protein